MGWFKNKRYGKIIFCPNFVQAVAKKFWHLDYTVFIVRLSNNVENEKLFYGGYTYG